MATQLVIVESPAKAKTINKYLGPDYKVLASYGHIRDLTPTKGAVDPENHFAMRYELIEKNKKHVDAIVKALASANTLILATDPDREGEAISWHLQEYLKSVGALTNKKVQRVTFFEITKKAVQQAMSEPRELSMDLVDAQQARRALDYLAGFNLSPLLWKKVRRGLSAGRVQSPALKLIVEREIEIEAFKQQEYWSIEADLDKDTTTFLSMLTKWKGEKLETLSIGDGDTATQIEEFLTKNLGGTLTVSSVEKKQRKRQPTAPFTTSTLQQEAARKLGFSAKKTMMVAQQLYEGIDTGEGTEGLITYMRTDSMNLSIDSVSEIRAYIESNYGKDFLPDSPKIYKTKAKNAQEAHEAIRPTSVSKSPEALKTKLDNDQYKLYNLIFKRTIACQMIHASLETVIIDFACEDRANFHSTGSTITHPGFMRVYSESFDDGDNKNNKDDEFFVQEMVCKPKISGVITTSDLNNSSPFACLNFQYGSDTSLVTSGRGFPNQIIFFKDLNHYRDFLPPEEICRAIDILRKYSATGIYNICSGKAYLLKEMANHIAKKYNKECKFEDGKRTFLIGDGKKLNKLGFIYNRNYYNYLDYIIQNNKA